MAGEFEGRVAVVTGATRGIGFAVASALAREGARVVAVARHPSTELDGLANVRFRPLDLVRPESPALAVAHAIEAFGRLDILVNNVGGGVLRSNGAAVSDEEWTETFEQNLMTAVRVCRAAVPHMTASGGSIVNVSSVNAVLGDFEFIDYSAAKAALASFTKSLAVGLARHRIRANVVSPGPVLTRRWTDEGGLLDQIAAARGGAREQTMDAIAGSAIPLGRFIEPDEIASVVLFLVSERAAMITGSDYRIDGGLIPTI